MVTFVIEHLEPELFEWCVIEYKHISKIVGKENLIFTNIKPKFFSLLKNFGEVVRKKFSEFASENFLNSICVLSPESEITLKPEDAKHFEFFVFGGILGDNPPKKRTEGLIYSLKKNKVKFEIRNLGKMQMSTDTAVLVAKKIVDGKKFHEMEFFDEIEIEINEGESVIFPYRYVVENGKPVVSEELIGYLKREDVF